MSFFAVKCSNAHRSLSTISLFILSRVGGVPKQNSFSYFRVFWQCDWVQLAVARESFYGYDGQTVVPNYPFVLIVCFFWSLRYLISVQFSSYITNIK